MKKKLTHVGLFALVVATLFLVVAWQPVMAGDPPGEDSVVQSVDDAATVEVVAVDGPGDVVFAKGEVEGISEIYKSVIAGTGIVRPPDIVAFKEKAEPDLANCNRCHRGSTLSVGTSKDLIILRV